MLNDDSKRDLPSISPTLPSLLKSLPPPSPSSGEGKIALAGSEISFDDFDDLESSVLATLNDPAHSPTIYMFTGQVPNSSRVVRVITDCEETLCSSLVYFERTPKVDETIVGDKDDETFDPLKDAVTVLGVKGKGGKGKAGGVVEEGEGDLRGTVVVVGGKKIDFGMIAGGVNTVVQEMDADADTGEDDEEGK